LADGHGDAPAAAISSSPPSDHRVRAKGNFHRQRKPITRVQSTGEKDFSFAFPENMIV